MSFSVALSVVEWEASNKLHREGLCTPWLERILAPIIDNNDNHQEGEATLSSSRLRVVLKPATDFTLPSCLSTPVIMIGPGTGVAPFIGFIDQRRQTLLATSPLQKEQKSVGPMWLYFGCRHRDRDWIFREEMEAAAADGTLARLRTAFSREGPSKVTISVLAFASTPNMVAALCTLQVTFFFFSSGFDPLRFSAIGRVVFF